MNKIINYFIIGELTQDIETQRHAQLIVISGFLLIILQLFHAGVFYKIGYFGLSVSALISAFGFLSIPFILKFTTSIPISGNLILLNGALSITINAYNTGNLFSVINVWLCTLPLSAILLVGRRASLAWGGIACGTIVCFFVLHENGYTFPTPPASIANDPELMKFSLKMMELSVQLGVTSYIMVCSFYYEGVMKKTNKQLIKQSLELTSASECLQKESSGHKQVKMALQESEVKYKSIVENSNDVIILTQPDGTISYISPACHAVLGWEPETLINRQPFIHHPDDIEKVKALFANALNGEKGSLETRIITEAGELKWVFHSWSPLFSKGRLEMIVSVVRDITARKKSEEALKQSLKTKTVLLQEVNHRVKNNLVAINGMLLIERNFAEKATRPRTTASVLNDLANRIKGLSTVHDMLSASEWAPMPLHRLAREVTEAALKALPSDKYVKLEISYDTAVMLISKQAHHITIIINELAANVIKYAASANEKTQVAVHIANKSDKNEVLFEFRDNGPGFSEKALRPEGGNVGMYLMKNTVRHSLHGQIDLHNDNGAVIAIRFKHET